jgi:cytochrome oxidase Cu insertion factor (SCO1/SenC/PrrC family)
VVAGAVLLGGCGPALTTGAADDDLYPLPEFKLTERSGRPVGLEDLRGKVWIAAFVFTRCAGPCTQVSGTMARIQHDLAAEPDVVLVSFTVDPAYDTPQVLTDYGKRFGADPARWFFLTGEPATVYKLIREGFRLTAQPNEGSARTPGNEVLHDTRLAVVDRRGHIRGYFQATDPAAVAELEAKVRTLVQERP